jgi:hypothetical protein
LRGAACLLALALAAVEARASDALTAHLTALAETLPEPARDALHRIETTERKLLAARSYAKSGNQLIERWSWTAAQIREAEQSHEYRRMLASIRSVTARFEAENPGFSLYANTQVRTLELQLERWNTNPRVGKVALELKNALARELRAQDYPATPSEESLSRFEAFLLQWYPSAPAPLAAPGLSAHGQLRAIDFQITKAGRVVAGTSVASVAREWEQPRWHDKLRRAVESAGAEFSGPLRAPNEPWHYTYVWGAQVARASSAL